MCVCFFLLLVWLLSGKSLVKETGGLETIAERNQTTVEVQGETESLGTSVDGKTKYKRQRQEV